MPVNTTAGKSRFAVVSIESTTTLINKNKLCFIYSQMLPTFAHPFILPGQSGTLNTNSWAFNFFLGEINSSEIIIIGLDLLLLFLGLDIDFYQNEGHVCVFECE